MGGRGLGRGGRGAGGKKRKWQWLDVINAMAIMGIGQLEWICSPLLQILHSRNSFMHATTAGYDTPYGPLHSTPLTFPSLPSILLPPISSILPIPHPDTIPPTSIPDTLPFYYLQIHLRRGRETHSKQGRRRKGRGKEVGKEKPRREEGRKEVGQLIYPANMVRID